MWQPPRSEDETPWSRPAETDPAVEPAVEPEPSERQGLTGPADIATASTRVDDAASDAPTTAFGAIGAPPAPKPAPPTMSYPSPPNPPTILGQPAVAPVTPPPVRPPGPVPPGPRPLAERSATGGGLPSSLASAAHGGLDADDHGSPRRPRRWPLVLLALATVAASGLVSWLVASAVTSDVAVESTTDASAESVRLDDDLDDGDVESASSAPSTTTGPAISQATADALADEPFALAAEKIRPSVVQLDLGDGLGTGVIIDSDGTILTAAHVVGNSAAVRVTFFDGSSVDGRVVGTHAATDVAVVSVDPGGRDLIPATLADGDDVRVGQIAVAVGSPFGFDQTVTAGIISAVDRIVNGVSMVQTDAPINPGNSGGPLINLDGEVVGINDLIFTESGSNAGVGFAISIDLAIIIAEQLIDGVEPQLALLGVSTGPPPNGDSGAQVGEVVSGSAAEDAGIEVGDIVVGVNGVATRGSADLRAQIIDNPPGTTVTLTVVRNGERLQLKATLGQTGLN